MKEIELLKIIFKDSPDILEPLNEIDKEIEKLNNIINKLEKRIVMKTNSDFIDTKVKDVCCELYQILQELKGDSSNE